MSVALLEAAQAAALQQSPRECVMRKGHFCQNPALPT